MYHTSPGQYTICATPQLFRVGEIPGNRRPAVIAMKIARHTPTPSFLRRNVTPYPDTGQESIPGRCRGAGEDRSGHRHFHLLIWPPQGHSHSEEPSDEDATISPPPGERYREGVSAIQLTETGHLRDTGPGRSRFGELCNGWIPAPTPSFPRRACPVPRHGAGIHWARERRHGGGSDGERCAFPLIEVTALARGGPRNFAK